MYDVIPGILEKEWAEIEKKIELVRSFVKTIHIDIIDGKFTSNTTFLDPKPFEKYSKDIFFEAHLMVEEPISYLESFAAAGFKRFLGHIEKMSNQEDFVAKGESLGEVGLALDGNTPLESLKADYQDLDCVLIMSIKAGFSAQEFMPEALEKVKKIREQSQVPVEVDGGINDATIVQTKNAGATRFVATSFISTAQDPKAAYAKLVSLVSV